MDEMKTKEAEGRQIQTEDGAQREKVQRLGEVLRRYMVGKKITETRIRNAENWWKMHSAVEEGKESGTMAAPGFKSASAWLHNVIVSKHADAYAAYPEPIVRAREIGDRGEALKLQSILPVIMDNIHFKRTYGRVMWDKMEYGTGIYKIIWDPATQNGVGDIAIEQVNPLNVFWKPGIEDIQKSRYFFQIELMEREALEERYPVLVGKNIGIDRALTKFQYDDAVSTEGMVTVVDCYTKRQTGQRTVLDYCRFVGDTMLYDSTADSAYAERGWYDHGLFPYVFDALYPVKGSPLGYGYVEVCRSAQTTIDMLNTAMTRNAIAGSSPRYFLRQDSGVNEAEFSDISRDIVHVNGNLGSDSVLQIPKNELDETYVYYLDRKINELRETSGNTETSTGSSSGGVTAASAIAALQEASGKGSRDSTEASYEAFREMVEIVIELIRQFYDMPRQFRIMGNHGMEQYIQYSNEGIQAQQQTGLDGQDMGLRKPVFDVTITAQKKDSYTRVSQNELALQFFNLGFFNPQMCDQALSTLELMDFDGKDTVMDKIRKNGTIYTKLTQYMQMALIYANAVGDKDSVAKIEQDAMAVTGTQMTQKKPEAEGMPELPEDESPITQKAREKSAAASQPEGGEVVKSDDGNTVR